MAKQTSPFLLLLLPPAPSARLDLEINVSLLGLPLDLVLLPTPNLELGGVLLPVIYVEKSASVSSKEKQS
jgi:hypothetical protein